ncbi:phenylacetate--CoA ligase family protein [Aureivirga sp. CE67]|uniref:phenylacetate--CoA ligase family protein n=1 Tax=Aureivirga sp. CE67 TaxID=1788983 RepID=UPI0018C951C1|nr:phenylacetate--CoA ligase family protein [Aureivirga sp. CE67]
MFKQIFLLGQKLRNPSLEKTYDFLKESEKWSISQLEIYQLKRLQKIVSIAYNSTEFYKESFDQIGVKPNDIKSLDDLKKLPILTKNDLLSNVDSLHSSNKFQKIFIASTSGTTGNSLSFKRNEEADSFNRASIFRGYSWYDLKPWESNGYFWGFSFSKSKQIKTKILDSLQNRFRLFSYEENEFKSFVNKLKNASLIHGYSSTIYQVAKLINENNLPKPKKLKLVKGTSEKIKDRYREEIQKAFGLKISSEYGATESGIIAFECPEGNMHLNMEGVIVEEIDQEILITNLQLESFPIIRYKLGDYIRLASKEKICKCGMKHHILEEITGRIGEEVYGISNIYPSFYFYYIFKNLDKEHQLLLNYQVIQNKKGELEFKIEQTLTNNETELLETEIKKYFKTDMNIRINDKTNIQSKKGKLKSFISNIN